MTRRIPPVRRLLMDAQKLIRKPESWCKGAMARTAMGGGPADVFGRRACCFCPLGAIWRAEYNYSGRQFSNFGAAIKGIELMSKLLSSNVLPSLAGYSDAPSTTHPMVMRLFNKAIRRAREQGI